MRRVGFLICVVLLLAVSTGSGGEDILPAVPDANGGDAGSSQPRVRELPEYVPSAGNLANRKWFREARFGLFIHWGIYTALGQGEWVLQNADMKLEEYRKLAPRFFPALFNATEWVQIAQQAGMKYITFTAKHHDGFCLWHTKQTTWNVVDSTPFARDILRELAEAVRAAGMRLYVYYSPLDWSHTDYYPRGFTGHSSGRPERGEWASYLAYMHRQMEEILTEYPDVAGLWLDGWWDKPSHEVWRTEETYALLHRVAPDALVSNNHHRTPFWGEDTQIFEKDAPGENAAGFAHGSMTVEQELPLETCDTIHLNGAWGYVADPRAKSRESAVKLLVRTAGFDANLLLNVGPPPSGELQREAVDTLHEVGTWLRRFGHSVYSTRGGPSPPMDWGVTTQNNASVFVHVIEWPVPGAPIDLLLPGVQFSELQPAATVLSCTAPNCEQKGGGLSGDAFVRSGEYGWAEVVLTWDMYDEADVLVRLDWATPRDPNARRMEL